MRDATCSLPVPFDLTVRPVQSRFHTFIFLGARHAAASVLRYMSLVPHHILRDRQLLLLLNAVQFDSIEWHSTRTNVRHFDSRQADDPLHTNGLYSAALMGKLLSWVPL